VRGYLTPTTLNPKEGEGKKLCSSDRSLLCDAVMSMKIRFTVLGGPRNPGRWPVLRKPPKLHPREDSRLHAVALDAVPASAF